LYSGGTKAGKKIEKGVLKSKKRAGNGKKTSPNPASILFTRNMTKTAAVMELSSRVF
jgi:hypothetical protein